MGPAAAKGKEWFTVPQASRILGVGKQTLYDAVKDERVNAVGTGWDRRIHAEEILKYAYRTTRDIEETMKRIVAEKESEIAWQDVLGWAIVAAGLAFLISQLTKKD